MYKRLKCLLIFLLIIIALLSGCGNNEISINKITISNNELYDRIAENVPIVKDMQCTLYKEISIINDEADFKSFYKEYLEMSNQSEQRNKINYGAASYILDSINEYKPSVRIKLQEYIGKGEYYVFEFASNIINDFNSQSIKYTVLINKESKNRIRIWKHNNTEGFGTIGVYIPNYDIWSLEYEEIYDE